MPRIEIQFLLKNAKVADFLLLQSPELILHKIWVIEKLWNFPKEIEILCIIEWVIKIANYYTNLGILTVRFYMKNDKVTNCNFIFVKFTVTSILKFNKCKIQSFERVKIALNKYFVKSTF